MNYLILRGKMVEAGYTQRSLAQKIGITPQSLCRKINGQRQFTVGEAAAISDLLGLDAVTKAQIFLHSSSHIRN